ncbi:hypothetical protein QTP70_026381, partial [Hemibagrus guttatus]
AEVSRMRGFVIADSGTGMLLGRVAKSRQREQMSSMSSCFSQQEMQTLERSNAALLKEISELQKEKQHYTTALKEHEHQCTLSCWSGPSITDMSTSNFLQTFNSPKPEEEPIFPTHDPAAPDESLADLLDKADWTPWDFDIRLPPF